MMRRLRFLILASLLFWTQLALAGHGIEHALLDPNEACIECLALPGFLSIPSAPPLLQDAATVPQAHEDGVPPALTFMRLLPFRSRAPPLLPSI